MHDRIAVLDYGSQYTKLLARRCRELGFKAELLPPDAGPEALPEAKALILSGGPASVTEADAPLLDPAWLATGLPILGICYGMQRLAADLGGEVRPGAVREYGHAEVRLSAPDATLAPLGEAFGAWMSHGDAVVKLPEGFVATAHSADGGMAAMAHAAKRIHCLQFHPEVTHTPGGTRILEAFLTQVAGLKGGWRLDDHLEATAKAIQAQVCSAPVLSLVSGGVDSTVATALLARALPPEQVVALHIDSGLMRQGESALVVASLQALGLTQVHLVDASAEFFAALAGLDEPEAKRKAIGDAFVRIAAREVAKLGLPTDHYLAQGTLYTDLIESGKSAGGKAATIKTHHNVGSPEILALRQAGRLVEPNAELFKDEVREVGRLLGLPAELVDRHPFPGPGLGIRVLGEVTPPRVALLQSVDFILQRELRDRGLFSQPWQAFAVLTGARSVGVQGDGRTYGEVVALRMVASEDGMTADVWPCPWDHLLGISRAITNAVPQVNRVTYDLTAKPPGTIEWE